MKNLIFDTETTGLIKHPSAKDSVQPQIIEWGGALVDETGEVLREINLLINPGKPLPDKITKITGITEDDLEGRPKFAEVVEEIRGMFAEADSVIAHNLPFDSGMMKLELNRLGLNDEWPWPKIQICTVQEHFPMWGYRPKLVQLYQHYMGAKLDQTHRALDDVMALVEICKKAGVLR